MERAYQPILAILAFTCVVCGCATFRLVFEKPTVDFEDFQITNIDFTSISTNFDFKVTNPNPIGIRLNGFDYQFIIEGNQLLSGSNPNQVSLQASGTSIISVPITLKYLNVYGVVSSLKDYDDIPYTISGTFFFNTPIGKTPISFSKSGELPVLRMPKISLSRVAIKNLGLTKADIVFDLNFENPNAFGVTLDNFSYNVALNDLLLAEGTTPQQMALVKKATSSLQIPISLNFIEIGRAVRSILTQKTVNYQLKGAANLVTPFRKIDLPYDQQGEINIFR